MPEKYLLLLLGSLVAAYLIVFMLRRHWSGAGRDGRSDDSSIAMGLQKKQEMLRQRIDAEKREQAHMAPLLNEQEEALRRAEEGEHVYPVHKTHKDYLESEYRVGEEKENSYPERHTPPKKDSASRD